MISAKYGLWPTVFVLSSFLTACGWVDSTGKQPDSSQALSDPTLILVNNGDAFAVNERTEHTIAFSGADQRLSNWTWQLQDKQANVQACSGENGFDQAIASNSLSNACALDSDCQIAISEIKSSGITNFKVTAPELRAPTALQYQLSTFTEDGTYVERQQTLCALSINEAPDAVDDRISVLRGASVFVDENHPDNLLANDTDDIDARNQPLRVITTPVRAPRFAKEFVLYENGSYLYEPVENAPLSVNGAVSDSFIYSVTDGTHSSNATVRIKVSNFNSAPTLVADIPNVGFVVAESSGFVEQLNLANYFSDAENDALSFRVQDDSLPQSGNITLSESGILSGVARDNDTGLYVTTVNVSDSIKSIDAEFFLYVTRATGKNKSPSVSDISNKTVEGEFQYDVSDFFKDADNDHLYFTATGLPPDTFITPKGVIVGTATSNNKRKWVVRVHVDDGNGGSTNDGFRLTIK